MEARDLTFDDIVVGATASFSRTITEADVDSFVALSGDANPLHTDTAYAATTQFARPIVHGMLLGSFCSTLVGMYLPGKRCLYVSQNLLFKKPTFVGDEVHVAGIVTAKSAGTRLLTIMISMIKGSEEVLAGEAKVQVLS